MISPHFLARLADPPKRCRPIPFWSWNERLDSDETRRQIDEMDRAGIGGYFMHARGGLQTEYMGDEWMANIRAGIEEGAARGMGAWAYDENGWPSGFGNGRVNGRGLAFQQKYLRMTDGNDAPDERTIGEARADGPGAITFYYDVNPFYVDTLDANVIRVFLEEIYDPYAERLGDALGKAMPGFFTDEPQISRNGIPWSFVLPDAYREAYGEDLLPRLPELFLATGTYRRTRYRFWHLVQELFVTAFSEQIYTWCEAHGAELTGHMVLEETLQSQITSNAAVMPHYEFFHEPGMDWLGRHINPPTTPLQVSSVAHQLGRKHVLSETFALTGWNVSFDELRWMYEWQMVRGITQLCQHLEGYSLRGIRKRDYPPSLFFQQPWWDRYSHFNDAMSRIGMLLADGEPLVDALVVHPQSSAWLRFDNGGNAGLAELNAAFMQVTTELEALHIPFHFGDERILRRHGSVEEGMLRVGQMVYSTVIVPPCDTLADRTVALLTQFAAAGGQITWIGTPPSGIAGGEDDGRLAALLSGGTRAPTVSALPEAARNALAPVGISTPDGQALSDIAVTRRAFDATQAGLVVRFVYLVNSARTGAGDTVIRLAGRSACRLDPESGDTMPIGFSCDEGALSIPHRFQPMDSLCLLVSDDAAAFTAAREPPTLTRIAADELGTSWDLELLDPNALTLDTCDIWFDGERIAEDEHISVVQGRALALERPVDIRLHFRVTTQPGYCPPDTCSLVIETPDAYTLTVNGVPVPCRDAGFYRDTSFRMIPLGGVLQSGTNDIVLAMRFEQSDSVYENLRRSRVFEAEKNKLTYDSEVEAAYLVGPFGVYSSTAYEPLPRGAVRTAGPFRLGPRPPQVTLGDLVPQGLPFFNGTVRLSTTLTVADGTTTHRALALSRKMGHIVDAAINGQAVAAWFWGLLEAAIPDGVLQPGENTVTLTITGGLRNLLGPHHLEEGESYAVAPGCFFKEPGIWGTRPWRDDYCFTEFGVRIDGDEST